MGPAATTALGILAGLIVFLAAALTGVIAVNGVDNPGFVSLQPSAAAGGTDPGPGPGQGLDLNGDGLISLAEAAGHGDVVTRFERADRDKDGKLSKVEFDRLAKLPPPKARKPRPQVRRDAAAALARLREEQ
jgi:hypothetical protein